MKKNAQQMLKRIHKDKKEGKKVTKDDICRAIIPKDYMKKKL